MSAARLMLIANALPDGCGSYLEVGVQSGATIECLPFQVRVGVDPNPTFMLNRLPSGLAVHTTTSDLYFAGLQDLSHKFDLVFIDGLHEGGQVLRDISNALTVLSLNGVILLDDVWPDDAVSALPSLEDFAAARARGEGSSERWQGTVFQALASLSADPDLHVTLVTTTGGAPQLGDSQDTIQAIVRPKSAAALRNLVARPMTKFGSFELDDLPYQVLLGAKRPTVFKTSIPESRVPNWISQTQPKDRAE